LPYQRSTGVSLLKASSTVRFSWSITAARVSICRSRQTVLPATMSFGSCGWFIDITSS
jgi:hypothetical protein